MPDPKDPKDDRLAKSGEIMNVFDPKVAQELFDEAMGENAKLRKENAELRQEVAAAKKEVIAAKEVGASIDRSRLISATASGFLAGLVLAVAIYHFSPKSSESTSVISTSEISNELNTSSFEAAKKGRGLTLDEVIEYSLNLPDGARMEVVKIWDQEKIVCVDISLRSEYEPKWRFLKLSDELYSWMVRYGPPKYFLFSEAFKAEKKTSESTSVISTSEISNKFNIYSFEGAKKGRALTVEEAVEYSVNLPDDTRREIIKSWDEEKIVCVDISLKSEHELKLRFFKLPDDLYEEIKYHGYFSPKYLSERLERIQALRALKEARRAKIQKVLDQLESPKKEAPKPKPEPIEY